MLATLLLASDGQVAWLQKMKAGTLPLWLLAIGLSGSLPPWAPPMTCPHQAPTLEPAGTEMIVLSLNWIPLLHANWLSLTSWIGLSLDGARTPLSWPWSAPATDTFWKIVWPDTDEAARPSAAMTDGIFMVVLTLGWK